MGFGFQWVWTVEWLAATSAFCASTPRAQYTTLSNTVSTVDEVQYEHTVKTATHCNTLQYTATHCNTLQHTATRTHTHKQSCVCLR